MVIDFDLLYVVGGDVYNVSFIGSSRTFVCSIGLDFRRERKESSQKVSARCSAPKLTLIHVVVAVLELVA